MAFVRVINILLASSQLCALVQADGFESFVRNKMIEFPEWIKEHNLDPSLPMQNPYKIADSGLVANLESDLSYMVVQGQANPNRIVSSEFDLAGGKFSIWFDTEARHTFFGTHKTNGSILSRPIVSTGLWNITVEKITSNFAIYFELGSAGYLNLTKSEVWYVNLPETPVDVYFKDVTDHEAGQGYEAIIKASLYKGFKPYIEQYDPEKELDPIRSTFELYWKRILAETTLADIIGATDMPSSTVPITDLPTTTEDVPPPSTTVEPPSTTVDPPATTQNPCKILPLSEKPRDIILEETVLETKQGVDSDGMPVTITKSIVIRSKRNEL